MDTLSDKMAGFKEIFTQQYIDHFLMHGGHMGHEGLMFTLGLGVLLGFVLFFIFLFKFCRNSSIYLLLELFFEKIYGFFEEILGVEEKGWIKMYVTLLFFIILFSNLSGFINDMLAPIFGEVFRIPSSDINFNVAMAFIGLFIILSEQFKFLGWKHFVLEYFPIFGKNFIPYTKGTLPKYIDLPLYIVVKIFDIIISVFLGILDIIGHLAKIISLSFRLFGNMTSGGILLGMLFGGMYTLSNSLLGIDFPVVGPIILYVQGLLVAFIQALVFPLLISIFVKVSKAH